MHRCLVTFASDTFRVPRLLLQPGECLFAVFSHLNINKVVFFSTRAGFSADGAGESGLPAEGTCALSRALTRRISQKIVLDSSRERERKPLSTCRGLNLSTPTSMTTYLARLSCS